VTALKEAPVNRAIILRNIACAYCHVEFSDLVPFEKEHAIGRRFVPKGTLHGQWNLLLRSCRRCNAHNQSGRRHLGNCNAARRGGRTRQCRRTPACGGRKAQNAISRKTGKPVAAGEEPIKVGGKFGPATFTFSFSMPPQVHEYRLFQLARYQVAAFFYWTTFKKETGRGGLMPGGFYPLAVVRKADWGNPQMLWFMEETKSWAWRVHAIGADGYFKLATKRKSDTEDIWSWALEWNQNFRLVGFFGREELVAELEKSIPVLKMETAGHSPERILRYRIEVPLVEADDSLFRAEVEMPAEG
jgi:hypothetical protein